MTYRLPEDKFDKQNREQNSNRWKKKIEIVKILSVKSTG